MTAAHALAPAQPHVPTIVFVDDEEAILLALRGLLRKEGYLIHTFKSGTSALSFLEQNEADVIVSDMRMPEMTGVELLERSAVINPRALRIILSGYEEKSVVLNVLSNGLTHHYIMKPWDDDNLRATIREGVTLQRNSRQQRLLEILHSFNHLPSPPRLHTRLLELLKETHSPKEMVAEIERNPALVAKLLQIANSVFYSVRNPVTSVSTAVTFIGTDEVVTIVLGFEAFKNVNRSSDPSIEHRIEQQWDLSVLRAQVARTIASHWPTKVDPQEPYTAALMLDIGLVLRLCSAPERLREFESLQVGDDHNPIKLEAEFFGASHSELGAAVLTHWNFPAPLIAAVANHHSHAGDSDTTLITQLSSAFVDGRNALPHDPRVDAMKEEFVGVLAPILSRQS